MPTQTVLNPQMGDLLLITHPNYNCRGIIYQLYDRFDGSQGIAILTETGENTGGWEEETWQFLSPLSPTTLDYHFTSASQLADDFRNGVFDPYFAELPLDTPAEHTRPGT